MFRNYLLIAWRKLAANKMHSLITISGLSAGMAVAILIGLWVWDELSFDHYHPNHDRIAQVMQHQTFNNTIQTGKTVPFPLGQELRKSYGNDFKYIVMSSWIWKHIMSYGDKTLLKPGSYMDTQAPDLLSLRMVAGTRAGLQDPSSILLSQSTAQALLGNADPIGKILKLDNDFSLKVTGVYEDLPDNTTLKNLAFIIPWSLYPTTEAWVKKAQTEWGDNSFQLFVQIADHADMPALSARIKNIKENKLGENGKKFHPTIELAPMNKWHLYSTYKNGINIGGGIQMVWMFGIIGIFVLLLACINFMNITTARSEKRSKEVGIRKAVGSLRWQLMTQFFSESLLIVALALIVALIATVVALPYFNAVAGKKLSLPWNIPLFWLLVAGFGCITGLIAGGYPALFLSSFRPIEVLKGGFKAGPAAAIPRKVLVVVQFAVSVILIIGTIVVFRQIQFAKNRPIGYSSEGLIQLTLSTDVLYQHFPVLREELLKSGAIQDIAAARSPITSINNNTSGFQWKGKDPAMSDDFGLISVSDNYGKTMGWQFKEGRDFSSQLLTDSSSIVLNEAAAAYMGLTHPVGEVIRWKQRNYTVIGVIRNMITQSPYESVKQSIFYMSSTPAGYLNLRLNSALTTQEALRKIETICKQYAPAEPFQFEFADKLYARKFADEERIGKLAGFFALLAIFISCLGLFGMASFMAEQRTKEIGVRKVLGASVLHLWGLLSKDFMTLVLISLLIATPAAWYAMHAWLNIYQYHTPLSWWIFAIAGAGALLITLCTISFQTIKAALANPVKSLKTE